MKPKMINTNKNITHPYFNLCYFFIFFLICAILHIKSKGLHGEETVTEVRMVWMKKKDRSRSILKHVTHILICAILHITTHFVYKIRLISWDKKSMAK